MYISVLSVLQKKLQKYEGKVIELPRPCLLAPLLKILETEGKGRRGGEP
jgi:hypothetical protein